MAALLDASAQTLVALRQLHAGQLNDILEEETQLWQESLDWDFRPSADLVRRFVSMQALTGYALLAAGKPIGYSYYVCEDRKGLIGDLYLLRDFRTVETENSLLGAVVESLVSTSSVRRIESQMMLLASAFDRPVPHAESLRRYRRDFMTIDLVRARDLPPGRAAGKIRIENWRHRVQEEAAHLIASAYCGHIDSEINDQYRSVAGARRFLLNIVQYPGCGSFFQPASFVGFLPHSGHLCGLSLSSLVAPDVGHITQICAAPSVKGTGVGYELLRRSLEALAAHGCRKVSLTVTAANTEAVRLYERMGFLIARTFAAYVWEGF
jgi:ribosomal protein S18 acetylase RimI-like enzyme